MPHDANHRDRWDRGQVAREGSAADAAPDATWDRDQMERDQPDDIAGTRDPAIADDAGPLSGHGQPDGESHWERADTD